MSEMPKFSPCLWFDGQVEEAAAFYVEAFEEGKINQVDHYVNSDHQPAGSVLTVSLTLCGLDFLLLNGGPEFSLTPAISFYVECETEAQIDRLWAKLSQGGTVLMEYGEYPFSPKFGWVNDRYGVSWQLVLAQRKQSIAPAFLFTQQHSGQAEAAMKNWIELFGEGQVEFIEKNPDGTVAQALFTLHGQPFRVMDGGAIDHAFTFTMGTSLYIDCKDQAEIDRLWEAVTAEGKEWPCGWMEDQYGVAWQTGSKELERLLDGGDPERASRVMRAMDQMKKIDLAALKKVYEENN
jgi:predicted 3-demethylubiquinone-9 3-methyltransferase (glyoxalase superfamily)